VDFTAARAGAVVFCGHAEISVSQCSQSCRPLRWRSSRLIPTTSVMPACSRTDASRRCVARGCAGPSGGLAAPSASSAAAAGAVRV